MTPFESLIGRKVTSMYRKDDGVIVDIKYYEDSVSIIVKFPNSIESMQNENLELIE